MTEISPSPAVARLAGHWGTRAKRGAGGGGQVGTREWKDPVAGHRWPGTGGLGGLSKQGVGKWTNVGAGLWG